ncbi:malic enzyme, NAD binding domain protein [Cooperia oncophora]
MWLWEEFNLAGVFRLFSMLALTIRTYWLIHSTLVFGMRRIRGPEYDRLIDNFMKAVTKRFGRDTLIQFEDFANVNAFPILDRYKNDYCTFNDDIQGQAIFGTATVVVAGLLAATRVTKQKLSEQKIVFLGAGSAGLGVAELCVLQMMDEGLSREAACDNIFVLNSKGLITKERAKTLSPRHQQFAKDLPDTKGLLDVIKMVKPNALMGPRLVLAWDHTLEDNVVLKQVVKVYTADPVDAIRPFPGISTVFGAFTPEILREMAEINARTDYFCSFESYQQIRVYG